MKRAVVTVTLADGRELSTTADTILEAVQDLAALAGKSPMAKVSGAAGIISQRAICRLTQPVSGVSS